MYWSALMVDERERERERESEPRERERVIAALFVYTFVSHTQVCKWATSYSQLEEITLYSTRTLQ